VKSMLNSLSGVTLERQTKSKLRFGDPHALSSDIRWKMQEPFEALVVPRCLRLC